MGWLHNLSHEPAERSHSPTLLLPGLLDIVVLFSEYKNASRKINDLILGTITLIETNSSVRICSRLQ